MFKILRRTIRLLLDTRDTVNAGGLGIDREMAVAIYRVGTENEFLEVREIEKSHAYFKD